MKLRTYAAVLAVTLSPSTAVYSQHGKSPNNSDSVSMDVLGTISASLDDESGEWLTIAGYLKGEEVASASWERMTVDMPSSVDAFSQMMDQAGEHMTVEQRRQIEQMGEIFDGANPLAEALGQMTNMPGMGGMRARVSLFHQALKEVGRHPLVW